MFTINVAQRDTVYEAAERYIRMLKRTGGDPEEIENVKGWLTACREQHDDLAFIKLINLLKMYRIKRISLCQTSNWTVDETLLILDEFPPWLERRLYVPSTWMQSWVTFKQVSEVYYFCILILRSPGWQVLDNRTSASFRSQCVYWIRWYRRIPSAFWLSDPSLHLDTVDCSLFARLFDEQGLNHAFQQNPVLCEFRISVNDGSGDCVQK